MKKWNLPIFYCLNKFKQNIWRHYRTFSTRATPNLKKRARYEHFWPSYGVFFRAPRFELYFSVSSCERLYAPEIRREMNHARLSGVPNGVTLNHNGQAGTERFVCISCADGTDSAVTVVYTDYRRLASGAHVRWMEGDDSPYQTY